MSADKQLIIKNSVWLLLEKLILMAGGLLLSIAFARTLGPEQFGRFNYLLSFVALFVPVFALGMTNVLLREFSRQPERVADILRSCFMARLLAGLFVTGITCLGLLLAFGFGWKFQWLTLLLVANLSNAFEVYERWFQHKSLNPPLVKWRICNFVGFACLKLVVVFYWHSYVALIFAIALEQLAKNLGYRLLYAKYRTSNVVGQFDLSLFREIFAQSKFLILSSFAAVIYLKIDILMLEAMVSPEEVGVYSVAAKLSEVWYILPQVVISALFPKLLEIAQQSDQRYRLILQKGFDLLFIAALTICAGVYLLAPWLIDWLYGANYQAAAAILRLHIFACLFIFMRALLSQWLVSEKFAQFSLFSQLTGALSNVLLNLWLIPLYGGWGAALATVVSYALTSYVCLLPFARTRVIAWMMTKAMFFPLRLRQLILGLYQRD